MRFEITGPLIIIDPCYTDKSLGLAIAEKNVIGLWSAEVKIDEYERCRELKASKVGVRATTLRKKTLIGSIGVDSGQAGIYDEANYQNNKLAAGENLLAGAMLCPEKPWYSLNSDRTLMKPYHGAVPFGYVTSSGDGDGVYQCFIRRTSNGDIGQIIVDFEPDMFDEP